MTTCAMVELEVLFSARGHGEYEQVRMDRLMAYEWLPMPDEVWGRTLEVQRALSAAGRLRAVPLPDLLIAAVAERHQVTLLHYDADFDHVAAVTGQAVEWVVPVGTVP